MADEAATDTPAPIVGGTVNVAPEPDIDAELGEAGKKALETERKARRAAEKATKDATSALEKAQREAMSEQDRAVAEARDAGRTEALSLANQRLVGAEVKSAAVGRLTNPDLATRLLDLDKFDVGDDGSVDTQAISSAIDGLLETYPEIAKQDPTTSAMQSRVPQVPTGARGSQQAVSGSDLLRQMAANKR